MGPDPRSAQISPCCRIYEPLKWIQKQEVPAMSLIERKRKLAIIAITFFAVGSASLGIAYAKSRPPVPPVDVTKTDPSKGGPQPQPIATSFRPQAVPEGVRAIRLPEASLHIQNTRVATIEEDGKGLSVLPRVRAAGIGLRRHAATSAIWSVSGDKRTQLGPRGSEACQGKEPPS